jgi:hypothetical protein
MAITVADLIQTDRRPSRRPDVAFLLLDGLRRPGAAKSQDVALCALGLSSDGTPQPVALRIVAQETEQAWSDLLYALKKRGIGSGLLLVCCDDQPALLKAAQAAFPDTPLQISVAHRLLSLARKVDPQSRAACLAEARGIFSTPDLDSAVAQFRAWRNNWTKLGHRMVASLEIDLAACLMFHRFPADLWPKIRTVNLVERMFREARRVPQLGLPEALRDWEDSADAGEAESGIEIATEISAEVELPPPMESPAPVGLPALAEPPVLSEPLAWIEPPALSEPLTWVEPTAPSELPAAEPPALNESSAESAPPVPADLVEAENAEVLPTEVAVLDRPIPVEPGASKDWPSHDVVSRVPRVHSVDLSQDPDFMWWLGQYRQTHSRQSRVIVVVMSLLGLAAGIILARGI